MILLNVANRFGTEENSMVEKLYEDAVGVEVIDVETLYIKLHDIKGIKIEASNNCIVYKKKKETVVHIISEQTEKSNVIISGSVPGIVAGGNVSISCSSGVSLAIGKNIIQNNASGSSANNSEATITVPAGTVISVEDVSEIVMDKETKKSVKIKEIE